MSNHWTRLTAGALQLYDGSRLFSDAAVRERVQRQIQKRGEPFPGLVPPKPRDDAHASPVLTQADVKVALGGLPDRPFHFGMAAFLGDTTSRRRVEAYLHADMLEHAEAGDWIRSERDSMTVSRLSDLMLFEVLAARSRNEDAAGQDKDPQGSARVRCPECNGRGTAARSALAPCEVCGGGGTFLLTEARRAQAVLVTERAWHRRWKGRYNEFIVIPLEWERWAIAWVRSRLSGSYRRT